MSVSFQGVEFERLGHASVRIVTQAGTVLYIDPWGEVIDSQPQDGDLVFVTHDDFDHYDPEGIDAVAKPEATIAVYEAVDTSDLDRGVVDLPLDGSITVDALIVQSVPAYNDPAGDHVHESGEPFHSEGEVTGLVFSFDETVVYYPSDTDFLDHHESISVDVFLPPIGGHYTMDRIEAAEFARAVEPELVLPLHYDTFDAIETDVRAFAAELEDEGIRVETF